MKKVELDKQMMYLFCALEEIAENATEEQKAYARKVILDKLGMLTPSGAYSQSYRVFHHMKYRHGDTFTPFVGKFVKTLEEAYQIIEKDKEPQKKNWYDPECINPSSEYDIVYESYIIREVANTKLEEQIVFEEKVKA